jgi:hypothetical protein
VKWAANLWVWNGPRHPYLFDMKKKSGILPQRAALKKVQAEFWNEDVAGAELYWEEEVPVMFCLLSYRRIPDVLWYGQFMGIMPLGSSVPMDSFEGHKFSARKNGEVIL